MGGVLNRAVLPSAADGEHVPERDEQHAQDLHVDYDEDVLRRWISIATFGVLVLITGLVTAYRLPALAGSSFFPVQIIGFGIGELLVGTFVVYLAYPSAIGWVALASFFTMATGIVLSLGGTGALWTAIVVLIALGLLAAGAGVWRGVVSWNEIRRDEMEPTPA